MIAVGSFLSLAASPAVLERREPTARIVLIDRSVQLTVSVDERRRTGQPERANLSGRLHSASRAVQSR